jgi:HlyD family secretion protein
MSASADIQTKTHADVLAVPINSVTTRDKNDTAKADPKQQKKPSEAPVADTKSSDDKGTANTDDLDEIVFVLQADGTVKRVQVRTDIQDMNHIEVLSGVKKGDKVGYRSLYCSQ